MADREVLNPGGGPLLVPDVDAAIAAAREEDLVLMVDVGGGMEIPLDELVDDVEQDLVDESGLYRVDPVQPRNIYLGKTYVGVMFDPDVAEQVVRALNGEPPADLVERLRTAERERDEARAEIRDGHQAIDETLAEFASKEIN